MNFDSDEMIPIQCECSYEMYIGLMIMLGIKIMAFIGGGFCQRQNSNYKDQCGIYNNVIFLKCKLSFHVHICYSMILGND